MYHTFSPNVEVANCFWTPQECSRIEAFCLLDVPWFRVEYTSQAHANECVTPCWTSLYSSLVHGGIPPLLRDMVVSKSETQLNLPAGYFNVALMRLYACGEDNIAYHSDDRVFLEQSEMAIASATFGPASRTFSMLPVDDAWDTRIRGTANISQWVLNRGDLLAMRRRYTQLCFLHAVKPDPDCRTWRININLRRVRTNSMDHLVNGLHTFYKYCVLGDHPNVKAHLELENEQTPLEDTELFGESRSGVSILSEMYGGDDNKDTVLSAQKRKRQTSLFEYTRVAKKAKQQEPDSLRASLDP